jgi:midasin (ATPase involved in ribosome maturation)
MDNISNQNPIKNLNEFIQKVDEMKKQEKMDLSSDQDLSIAIMNLISIEEHFFFSGAKTGKTEYYDILKDVREMRKELLKKIIKEYEGEVWCISKHLLAASYRLMEVGTKQLGMNKKEEAYDLFGKAYSLYSLFWGLNMKLLNVGDIKKIDDGAINKHDIEKKNLPADRHGFAEKLGELVKKAIDCCIE